ncbi:type II toxin-antitoxin system RelE family toxin [Streptomyces corynorhini]|uniref:Type II toxin-antitoxin system RelE/ParE family toxin n=1 Tax=Streptomyces corynorhini TaxID=2282652 RepID=A0A370AZE3_9ACTN|nr:type II toxin-antitoxin system RelE/ParE family toxin [Streptomyces corynorhini]RDG32836.1 type II toxin-antitoxin system RelE/ParE family toxin [Streptomyces corynorhini]
MTYEIHWREAALKGADRFMVDDPAGLLQVFASVDLLAHEPRPDGSFAYGSPDLRRIQIGLYRVIYEIDDAVITITVMHLGRRA